MYLFKAMRDCHRRLVAAAEALRDELDNGVVSPKLLRLRREMATAARDNLATTQLLWSRIEREIPDIRTRVYEYDRLKATERDLHARYANYIAAWSVSTISADFQAFASAKKRFLDDLCRHARALDVELFDPACRLLGQASDRDTRAA